MAPPPELHTTLLASWRTNSRVTAYLVENIPAALWDAPIPGAPRRTVRMIAGHLHNVRCTWLKTLGQEHGIAVPASVDRRRVARRELLSAFVAHEGHHRGQLVMLARQLGHRLPNSISAGLWQWTKRMQEARGAQR